MKIFSQFATRSKLNMRYYRHPAKLLSVLATGALTLVSNQAAASAFALHEQNAALLGGFYAGSAAIAEDASTNWYNSAGLTRLKGLNIAISGVNISSQTEFNGTTTLTQPPGSPFTLTETGEASGGTARLVPAVHAAYKINPQFAVGLSVVAPFGLSTNYNAESVVRYNATESELKTIDISPSIAYQPLDWLSFGAGFDAEYAEVKLDAVIGCVVTPLCGADQTAYDSLSKNKASDWGYGWHAGALAVVEKTGTQLGLNFHSNIQQNLSGRSKLHGPLNPLGYESDVSGDVDLPWWLVGSITQKINDDFSVLGSVEYMHWSSVQKIQLDGLETGGATGTTSTSIDELNYEDTWGFFGALRYNVVKNIMVTVGGGYEQTPTNNEDRDVRLPDSNRWIASAGLRWVPESAKDVQLDVGYAHIWGEETHIDKTLPADTQIVTAVGEDSSQVNIVGAQLTLSFH